MRYMLLICADEKSETPVPPAEMSAIVQGHMRFAEELRAAGKMIVGERLRPEGDGTRIRLAPKLITWRSPAAFLQRAAFVAIPEAWQRRPRSAVSYSAQST